MYLLDRIFSLHFCLSCLKCLYSSVTMFSTRKLICLLIISYLLLMFHVSYHLFKYVRYISCTSYLIISLYRFPSWFIVYTDAVILEGGVVFVSVQFSSVALPDLSCQTLPDPGALIVGILVEASIRVKLR